jgi:hypothetical protein
VEIDGTRQALSLVVQCTPDRFDEAVDATEAGKRTVAAQLDPPGRADACYLPRSSHIAGNIQTHEMA